MASTAAPATAARGGVISTALGIGSLQRSQLEVLQSLVSKHLTDPSLIDLTSNEDFTVTSLERGIPRYEHPHLVAALDVFLAYQRNRRAQGSYFFVPSMRSSFKSDPRTRLIELYKRWLRTNAANASLGEDDVRHMCALCRDIINHPRLFPSRNPRSFMHTLAEVYDHLKLQLREVLEHDRTCAELASRALCLSRNLISDAITFLLLAATDLKQTDKLPSLEVVYLWQSLPDDQNPLPARADKQLQKAMKDAWATQCGSLIAAILRVRWACRLFDGAGAEDEASASWALSPAKPPAAASSGTAVAEASPTHPAEGIPALIAQVRAEFEKGNFKTSGLAGAFRDAAQAKGRQSYLSAAEAVFDLIYLLGDVLVQFHRISDGLGDYGMIRVAPWLHPFLEALVDKVQRLREGLESLNEAVDSELVLAKARGQKVKKPIPSQMMSARAHAAIDRAISSTDCHVSLLLSVFEELRARSAPERLPHVMEGLGDACTQLQRVLASPQFLARVGDACRDLPPLASMTAPMSQIEDAPSSFAVEVDGEMSEDEGSPSSGLRRLGSDQDLYDAPGGEGRERSRGRSPEPVVGESMISSSSRASSVTGLHLRSRAASALRRLTSRRGSEDKVDATKSDGGVSSVSSDAPAELEVPAVRAGAADAPTTLESADSAASQVQAGAADAPTALDGAGSAAPQAGGDSSPARGAPEAAAAAPPALAMRPVGAPAADGSARSVGAPRVLPAPPAADAATEGAPVEPVVELQGEAAPQAAPPPEIELPRKPSGDLRAEVYRLTIAVAGWKHHDQRSLLLTSDYLHIFEKGSKIQVKTIVRLAEELDQCSLLGNGIMSLQIRRAKRPSMLFGCYSEVSEQKVYLFEFGDAKTAEVFHAELTKPRAFGQEIQDLRL